MDIKVIVSLVGVSGIVIAAVMSSYGYMYRSRQEYKKNSRKVLYLLLEIRYSVMKSIADPKQVTDEYIQHLLSKFSARGINSDNDEIDGGMRELVGSHIHNVITLSISDIEERLIPEYDRALSEFAKDNPVVAYILRGREGFNNLIKLTEEYQDKSMEYCNDNIPIDWIKDVVAETAKEVKLGSYKDILETLDEDVIRLAKVCGRRDFNNCKKLISNSTSVGVLMNFKNLDRYIDKYINNLIIAANKNAQN